MRKIYTLLSCALLCFSGIQAQLIYSNTTLAGSLFNPRLGTSGTPKVVFDDINIPSGIINDADSIGFTNIKVGITRLANAPAVTVNVYLTGLDPTSFGLDSVVDVPGELIGTFNLPANGATQVTRILSVGDSINIFKSLLRDTGNFFNNFQTAFVGISFSNANTTNGWRLTSGGGNYNGAWLYNVDSVAPRNAFGFAPPTLATFYIQAFGKPVYTPVPVDARVTDIITPSIISCYNGPQTISVEVTNNGTSSIAAGAAAVKLKVGGANTYNRTINNSAAIPPNGTALITFNDVALPNAGDNFDTATVSIASDARRSNDTLVTDNSTASTIATFPAVEDAETTLPVFPAQHINILSGTRQLWRLQTTPPRYINADFLDSLGAAGGNNFFLYDAYSGASSVGNEVRFYSNCLNIGTGAACNANIRFFMSHDNSYPTDLDSIYVSVTTNRGATWSRIAGFGRVDAAFTTPAWRQETVDLNAYKGQIIQIGFEGVSKYGNIMGLDEITINSNCITPVTLVSFTAEKFAKNNKLTWKTSQEINSAKFVIQQSKNGRDYTDLGQIVAAGNSTTEKTYTFTHANPTKGYNYYRIKMVDIDNLFKLSAVRNLQNLGNNEIVTFPNPVKNNLTVQINSDNSNVANVQVSDLNGRVLFTKAYPVTEGNNNLSINTTNLANGNYIIKVQMSADVIVNKFSKL